MGGTGAAGGASAERSSRAADAGSDGGEPTSACDTLATCCATIDPTDPAADLCEEILSIASPTQCANYVGSLGCSF
jgi:hypothetical protein